MKFPSILPLLFSLIAIYSFSQSNQNIPLYREKFLLYEKYLNSTDCSVHTSIKPYYNTPVLEAINDTIKKSFARNKDPKASIASEAKKTVNTLSVTGVLSSDLGYEQAGRSENKFLLDGGLKLEGTHLNKFSYNFIFLSGNSSFPSYIDSSIKHSSVVPGIGNAYGSTTGYSYQYYSGYFSYSPNKIFNFQIGKDKHFWGDGYRSLFISDVSNSYPFLQLSATVWKLKYVCLFAWMKDVTAPSGLQSDFKNKFGSFHYLSWNVTKRFNMGLFESVIWQGTDANRTRSFDVNYLNPVIFYRPVEYSLGSSDNALIGISFKEKIAKKQLFYGQLIIDDLYVETLKADIVHACLPFIKEQWGWWGNKYGFQLGFKSFDLFTIKNLSFQTEVNRVRPYTYSHGSVQQNYGNYNQPLADPLGANFTESVSFLNYRYKKWMFETEFLYAQYGKDENGINYGGNIFLSYITRPTSLDYYTYVGQGLKTNLSYTKLQISYYPIPSADLMAEAGVALRQENNSLSSSNSTLIFIGIKTGIMNRYSDF